MDSLEVQSGFPAHSGTPTRYTRTRRRWSPSAALLLPSVLLVVFFAWPVIQLWIVSSLHAYSRLSGVLPGLTLENYVAIASGDDYRTAILRTLRIAFGTCALSLVLGYPVALYTNAAPSRQRGIIIFCIVSPLLVSVIVRTFGWLIIFGPNGFARQFRASPRRGQTVHPAFGPCGCPGLTNVLLPFLVLSILISLERSIRRSAAARRIFSCHAARVFFGVSSCADPFPGLTRGLLIVFSLTSSSFVDTGLAGWRRDHHMLSMVIYEQVAFVPANWPLASAVTV